MSARRTILVAEVEGSTRLALALGEQWDDVLAAQRRVLERAAAEAGGEVEAGVATFAEPAAAAAAAHAAQLALGTRRWPEGARVRVRMGIDCGETATILAPRIAAAAHGGQVLISGSACALLEDKDCRDLGLHRLKDFPEPQRLFQLRIEGEGVPRRFPPPRTLGTAALDLQERDEELDRLAVAIGALVDDGTGGVVLIGGPPGIGKSALLGAALELPAAQGALVLRARGAELEGRLSFGAVRDLFAPAVLAAQDRDVLLDGPAALARPVLGLGETTGGDPQYGLFWLAAALSERKPLLLTVDDLQWVDEESAAFLAYLAPRLEGLPILVLASVRSGDRAAPRLEPATMIELAPLSAEAVARLVPDQPAEEVHRLTGGNPLLAVEVARALDEDTRLQDVAPKSVARSVLDRVARISDDAVALSRAVALSAEPLALPDAAGLAELELEAAGAAADALVRAQVLRADAGALEFLHPVMRTAVYEELEPFARRLAHARAARLLSDRGTDVETIAAHLLAGEPEANPETVRLLRTASERALARVAPRAAARYLERALAEPPPPGQERVNLRLELGRLQLQLGRAEAAVTLRAAFDEASQPEQRADIGIDLAGALIAEERYREATTTLVALGELDRERELLVKAVLWWAEIDGPGDPRRLAEYIKHIPPDLPGDTAAQRSALIVRAYARLTDGAPIPEVLELLERADASEQGRRWLAFMDETLRFRTYSAAGAIERAAVLAQELLERARETGVEAAYAAGQVQLAVTANQRGDLRGSEGSARLGLSQPGLRADMRIALEDWLVTTLSMQGRFEEAEDLLDTLADREPNLATTMLERRRGEIALDRGDYEAALPPLERLCTGDAMERLPRSNSIFADYAQVLAALGRRDEALPYARRFFEAAQAADMPQVLGIAHHTLGLVLGDDEGFAHLEQAVAVLEPTPYRWNLANAQVALGAALRRRNQRARARQHLAAALEYAVANGAAPIEKEAREELRLCGARPRNVMRTGVDSLTPSEERIARMAADGLSNKEIAQQLFVTVKNVEMHLVGAYRKLDVKSRRELPDVFATA